MKGWQKYILAIVFARLAVPVNAQEERRYGWTPDPEAVKAVQEKLKFKTFGDTPANKSTDPLPASVFGWQAYQKLFDGKLPPEKTQAIGDCVSFGTNNAICMTLTCAIAFGGASYSFKDIASEVTYGGARVQICRQRGGEGTNGSCAAKFVQQYGVCPREKIGGYDLTTYSGSRAELWGNKGVPKEIIDAIKANKVKDITLVANWAQAKTCLANGWGIAICSNVGFNGRRDANGIKKASGNWNHCMACWGYTTIDGTECGYIENSWGPEDGPVGPGNPNKAGFWASAVTVDKMIKTGGDSWAFSNVVGWEPAKIDWNVKNNPRPDPDEVRLATLLDLGGSHDQDFFSRPVGLTLDLPGGPRARR